MSAPTGDPELLVADQPEQDTNEVMTEDVETPHHDDVTDEPVLPDSEAEDDLVSRYREFKIRRLWTTNYGWTSVVLCS